MRRLLCPLGLAAALLGPALALAQPAQPLTLDQALDLAESRSFGLSAARRAVEAADGAVSQAGARPNPRLNASVEDTQRATRSTTATVDYPLELGGKRSARIDAAERGRDVAQAELGQAQAGLQASVIAAYFATLVAQERSKLAKDSADLATRGADAVAKRVAAGKSRPSTRPARGSTRPIPCSRPPRRAPNCKPPARRWRLCGATPNQSSQM